MSDFYKRVWDACLLIPIGKVVSYAEMARYLGCGSPRPVGQALNRNPNAPEVPCHRVVAADGRLSGYAKGITIKRELLQDEGVIFVGDKVASESFIKLEPR